jgi:exodeoxyribonuclease VII large subunit
MNPSDMLPDQPLPIQAMPPTITTGTNIHQRIYEVSEITGNIKSLLEDKFPFLWISAEISNFRTPPSGHFYFTLKDKRAQISAMIFRNQARSLKFRPEDGVSIIGLGRIGFYEPRGTVQVILEFMEPKGIGSLQLAFEKLKRKLSAEGLFDDQYKIPLPAFPQRVSVITSPTGAAVRDFINVAQRRYPNLPLEVVPVHVQGDHAPSEIVQAIAILNDLNRSDAIVLARGGGSIEDLHAFNDEQVARAIFESRIPIVSAIGHETDFTIADFVADFRAPTPSAAAEIVIPLKNEFVQRLHEINLKLDYLINNLFNILKKNYIFINDRIVHPKRRLQDNRLRLDELSSRMNALIGHKLIQKIEYLSYQHNALVHVSPGKTITYKNDSSARLYRSLVSALLAHIDRCKTRVSKNDAMLDALNPMAILKRGYSITRTLPGQTIVRDAAKVKTRQSLEILLGSGKLSVTVDQIEPEDDNR